MDTEQDNNTTNTEPHTFIPQSEPIANFDLHLKSIQRIDNIDMLTNVAIKLLIKLATPPAISEFEKSNVSNIEEALDAARKIKNCFHAIEALEKLDPESPPHRTENLREELAKRLKVLLSNLEGLTTETIEQKRLLVRSLNFSRQKLGLGKFLFNDKSVYLATSGRPGQEGLWQLTFAKNHNTDKINCIKDTSKKFHKLSLK